MSAQVSQVAVRVLTAKQAAQLKAQVALVAVRVLVENKPPAASNGTLMLAYDS